MYDVIIIGAGPAGLLAASEASKKYKTMIIEKNSIPGKKLLITGGGRCNITNLKPNDLFIENVNYNKKYLYTTINTFGPQEIYDYFSSAIKLKEEESNKIFPESNKAIDILNCLMQRCSKVEFNYEETVMDIIINEEYKEIITNKKKYKTNKIIIATGGASFKHTGSSGDHIKLANQIKQPVIDLFPAETSIILRKSNNLAGTAFSNVNVIYNKKNIDGNLMFTHNGISGESIMKISEHIYLNNDKSIKIDFKPNIDQNELLKLFNDNRNKQPFTILSSMFTKRFSNYLIKESNINETLKIKNLSTKEIEKIINLIKKHDFEVEKVNDLDKAYVTGGGINLKYIDTKTMESKISKGIYFVGEALDFHGPVGGYNLTIALSTGYSAGKYIANENNNN